MFNRVLVGVLICLIAGFTSTSASTTPKPIAVINLIPHPAGTYMMTMHARIRGHEGLFLFDTGGGISYISPSFAKTIGCKPWGLTGGFTMTGQRLDMSRCD